jgi:hypothetical protein
MNKPGQKGQIMNAESLKHALELIEQARLAKPLLAAALDAIMEDFGPELGRAMRAANDFWTGEKARSVKLLEQEGFSREEALLLACDAEAARQRLLRQIAARASSPKTRQAPAAPSPPPTSTDSAPAADAAEKH